MVKYPTKKQITTLNVDDKKLTTHDTRGRGMSLESMLNDSNDFYRMKERAVIHKKPTPVQIVKVDYPSRAHAKIVEAYFRTPSTTDYNGVYRGRYIDFEAKECSKKSFPFRNIHPHQIDHLDACLKQGGICFMILEFTQYNEVYLIDGAFIIDRFRNAKRQSLLYEDVKENAHLVPYGFIPMIDYLKVVDEIYFKEA